MAEVSLVKCPQMNATDDKSTLVQVMAFAIRQQAITWADVDPDLLSSLGRNELHMIIILQ